MKSTKSGMTIIGDRVYGFLKENQEFSGKIDHENKRRKDTKESRRKEEIA